MSFNYNKIDNDDSPDDGQQTHSGHNWKTIGIRACSTTSWFRWSCAFILHLAILAAELSILHRQPASLTVGSEINGLVPRFETRWKKYLLDDRFNSDHTTSASINETKDNWLDLLPTGGGFVHIPDPKSHVLPPPIHFPKLPSKNVYALAVFHQLHCLYHISASFDKLVLQLREHNFTVDEYMLGHNNHCFDYLREAVICATDTTLEGQAQRHGGAKVPGTDGTGGMHVCKDYDAVVSWMEERSLYDGVFL